ncbi:unnamed protein product [Allacma fusca]|uniref:Uncharacterized protein n=1 Tax=Allacma fusca TaxID=39272 RepID=A0A8J2JCN6_9HEXA|nr:unnamed protein product [Allacma fusca]
MSNSVFNPLIYGIFHLYRPRRKDLTRGNSSKKTLLTNLSLHVAEWLHCRHGRTHGHVNNVIQERRAKKQRTVESYRGPKVTVLKSTEADE